MSNATATRTVIAWLAPKSDVATLKMALALAELRASLTSDRAVNRHLQAALDAAGTVDDNDRPVRALSNKRIGWYVTAAAELPTDAAAFRAAYRTLAAADRAGAAAKRADKVTADTSTDTDTATGTIPQGNSVTIEQLPVDDAIRLIWELVEHHGSALHAALTAAAEFTTPVKVGTLVAA